MISYPFDPQCRLDSNWIAAEQHNAYPSSATRTVVPLHAPFFLKDAVIKKGNMVLVEGVHFYFSLKHKAASLANAQDVYGGITLIDDGINLPITVDYHPLGGAFEASAGQVKLYLNTNPDIWDGSWEALIVNAYYPPVNILFDPESFVSEPELIEACRGIESAIKAKDASDTISYQAYAARVQKLRDDLLNSPVAEHIATRGNAHGTKPHHIFALAKDQAAANTKRLEGADLDAFVAMVLDSLGTLEALLVDKIKNGDVGTWDSKFLLEGGSLLFGDTTSLYMDEEGIVQNGDNALTLIADSSATRPGTKGSLRGGGNLLTVTSTGNVQDDTTLHANEEEVITTSTLKSYVNGILADTGFGFSSTPAPTFKFSGVGTMSAPLEAIPTIPAASETELGVVKVVNEGSHGYPCPGYSGNTMFVYHTGGDNYMQLRNGADDLEQDVFYTKITLTPYTLTPTADRFRPAKLPITAKPKLVRYGTEDCVWLSTTDGEFILLTAKNPDPDTWRCLKVLTEGVVKGTPHLYNGKLYVVGSNSTSGASTTWLYEGTISADNTVTFALKTLTGNNFNGTPVSNTSFNHFDKIKGTPGDAKCMWFNRGDGVGDISIAHSGDHNTQVRSGGVVRVCHVGNMYAPSPTKEYRARQPLSYTINLVTGQFIPDNPGSYPIEISKDGYSHHNPRMMLAGGNGNNIVMGIVANGIMFTYDTYVSFYPPSTMRISPRDGISLYDELHASNQYWTRVDTVSQTGLYASDITTRPRGPRPLAGNEMVVECSNGKSVRFKYDPSGSYGPNTKGYGPTNDRRIIDGTLADNIARLCWVFDGDTIKHEGGYLTDGLLSAYTSFENDEFGQQISIGETAFNTAKAQAIDKFAASIKAKMTDSRLSVAIHRRSGLPMLGQLQVSYVADQATGRQECMDYFFTITPSNLTGVIRSIAIGELLLSKVFATTFVGFNNYYRTVRTNAHMYRLNDGGWLVAIGGQFEMFVGDGRSPYAVFIYNAAGTLLGNFSGWTNATIGDSTFGTKELGYGNVYHAPTAEGMYLNSYGYTTTEILDVIAGRRATELFIVVLSRTDAGDNVGISQFAASTVRNKILSLVPPTRKVQGMDMSQDRVVTKAMLANADKIPNQRDSTYPVQQKHRDSLQAMALKTHTHPTGDFIADSATTLKYGVAKLGSIMSPDTDAFSIVECDSLEDLTDALYARTVSLNRLDASITIDYEV